MTFEHEQCEQEGATPRDSLGILRQQVDVVLVLSQRLTIQDPALELSTLHAPNAAHIRREEQPLIDSIVRGEHAGGYYLVVGPKGTGKGTMILE